MTVEQPSYPHGESAWEDPVHEDEFEEEEIGDQDDDDGSGMRWTEWDMDEDDRWLLQDEANSAIDAYTLDEIDARVYVRNVPNKGRCLFTRYALKPGDVIFVESPLLSCTRKLNPKLWKAVSDDCKSHNLDSDMPAAWHYAALFSILHLDKKSRRAILDKWHPPVDPNNLSPDVVRICKNVKYARKIDPFEYDRMLNAWRYNCFGHHTDNHGLVCYNRISMMAHCCESSATWHYGTSNDQFVLRARHHLPKDGEITITYVGDEDLLRPKELRRDRLSSWLFVCRCVKCNVSMDRTRGVRCPSCGTGVVYFTTNDEKSTLEGEHIHKVTDSTVCNACQYVITPDEVSFYLQMEEAYIARLNDCAPDDILDCETVLVEAGRVMIRHYVLYELHTKLQEAYKNISDWESVLYHLDKRIQYVEDVLPSPSYQLAWMYEELGDTLVAKALKEDGHVVDSYWEHDGEAPQLKLTLGIKNRVVRCYETAMNLFLASCGDAHTYTLTAHWKMEFILSVKTLNSSGSVTEVNHVEELE